MSTPSRAQLLSYVRTVVDVLETVTDAALTEPERDALLDLHQTALRCTDLMREVQKNN